MSEVEAPALPDPAEDWQRLDPRMLLIYPVKELLRFLPVLLGLFVAGTASGNAGDWWHGIGIAIPIGLGVLRYFTTSFRIGTVRVELRRGLVNRHLLSTALDRVRTVDVTASPIHRALGLTTVRIGTGTASTDGEDHLDLDGLPRERAQQIRTELLELGSQHSDEHSRSAEAVVRFDPAWLRFAPLTSTGLVLAAGVVGVSMQLFNAVGGFEQINPEQVASDTARWSIWVAVPLVLIGLLLVVSALSIGGYVVTNWGFTLTHTDSSRGGAWHLRRGLLTTRETTLDDERVRGVSVSEPIGLRVAGGARASAIVTGLDREESSSSMLVPPAPLTVVHRVSGEVLGTAAPLSAALVSHGPRARTRRYSRALIPAVVITVVLVALVLLADLAPWFAVPAVLAIPVALALAADRTAALGHTLVEGYVVARSGSVVRRHDALHADGVIGWNLRATVFQRRAGLTSLVATTAGGRQSVTVLDVPEGAAIELARRAVPDLLDQFLADRP